MQALVRAPERADEKVIAEIVPWVHTAGNPYYDWFFGGAEAARRTISAWMGRPSSEVALSRFMIALETERPIGGYLLIPEEELARCWRSDALALLRAAKGDERSALEAKVAAASPLFPPVPAGALYLSKIGVIEARKGRGLGRGLLEAVLEDARAAGRGVALDVSADNTAARRLYSSFGFEEVSAAGVDTAGLRYLRLERR
jgi:ribosomal protein S18 acetylase RimI-like enzyme